MNVFISWSGERSKAVAEALHSWLPKIINDVKPWLSSADIEKGARWSFDIASKLSESRVGIICLTPDNLHADWILFEAGALSKTLDNTHVCPLLVGLEPADVKGPLAQFQGTRAVRDDVRKLLATINSALGERALASSHLNEAFDVWWPRLEQKLQSIPAQRDTPNPQRPEREILEEILELARRDSRRELVPRPALEVSGISVDQEGRVVSGRLRGRREAIPGVVRSIEMLLPKAARLADLDLKDFRIQHTPDGRATVMISSSDGDYSIKFDTLPADREDLIDVLVDAIRVATARGH